MRQASIHSRLFSQSLLIDARARGELQQGNSDHSESADELEHDSGYEEGSGAFRQFGAYLVLKHLWPVQKVLPEEESIFMCRHTSISTRPTVLELLARPDGAVQNGLG